MMIVVNFKTYPQATGYKARNLARTCRRVMDETKVRIVAVPQVADLRGCVEEGAECWVQHVDPVNPGKTTGWITLEEVEEAGAMGTLLNHAEHKLDPEILAKTMQVIAGRAFEGCVCAADLEELRRITELKPNYIAYEPPELIGNTERSVASEKPEVIEKAVQMSQYPILIGAGVHSQEDVKTGLRLGAKGILVSTDVVLAEAPETQLRELAIAFKS